VPALAVSALGTVLGFPIFLALALREVDAMHAAVVTGVLPLATAHGGGAGAAAAAVGWVLAVRRAGCALVLGFAAWQGGGRLVRGDGWLLLAVASRRRLRGWRACAGQDAGAAGDLLGAGGLACPSPALGRLAVADGSRCVLSAWAGFAYASVFSMWLGFFAWYRGLALGGVVRVSQVQLLQPFLALLFAVPVLGERLRPRHCCSRWPSWPWCWSGRRMPVAATRPDPVPT
jgi:drug/metabolite transporter (DMT)-like permease